MTHSLATCAQQRLRAALPFGRLASVVAGQKKGFDVAFMKLNVSQKLMIFMSANRLRRLRVSFTSMRKNIKQFSLILFHLLQETGNTLSFFYYEDLHSCNNDIHVYQACDKSPLILFCIMPF